MSSKINLGRLRNVQGATANYELTIDCLVIDGEINITMPVHVSVNVTNTGVILALKGHIKTEVTGPCNRCLEKVTIPVDTFIEDKLVHVADLKHFADYPEDELEEKFLIFDNDVFDLKDIVRENIILFLPAKILCDENCRGLCIKCGQNLNKNNCGCDTKEIDPRLAILAKLKGIEEV